LLVMVISCKGSSAPVARSAWRSAFQWGVRLKVLRFASPSPFIGVVLLLKLLFSGTTALFLHIWGVEIVGTGTACRKGLHRFRIAGAVSLVALLGFSTSFTDLMAALAWLRAPRGFIEVSLFAWRYLFVLFDDAQVVYAAQKNRLGYAGLHRGMRSFGTLAGALVIKAFDNSQTLTCAMVQRVRRLCRF
jgi:cobalt/nickel transport system permease protein